MSTFLEKSPPTFSSLWLQKWTEKEIEAFSEVSYSTFEKDIRGFSFSNGKFIITVKTSTATLIFPPLEVRQRFVLAAVFQQYPEFYGALIAQILPEALLSELKSKGVDLLSLAVDSLDISCSCVKSKVKRCYHQTTAIAFLSQKFSEQIDLILHAFGWSLDSLIAQDPLAIAKKSQSPPSLSDLLSFLPSPAPTPDPTLGSIGTYPEIFKRIPDLLPELTDKWRNNAVSDKTLQDIFLAYSAYRKRKCKFEGLYSPTTNSLDAWNTHWNTPKTWPSFRLHVSENCSVYSATDHHGRSFLRPIHNNHSLASILTCMASELFSKVRDQAPRELPFLQDLLNFTMILAQKQALVPLLHIGLSDGVRLRWLPLLSNLQVKEVFDELCNRCPPAMFVYKNRYLSPSDQVKLGVSIMVSELELLNPRTNGGAALNSCYYRNDCLYELLIDRYTQFSPKNMTTLALDLLTVCQSERSAHLVLDVEEVKGGKFELSFKAKCALAQPSDEPISFTKFYKTATAPQKTDLLKELSLLWYQYPLLANASVSELPLRLTLLQFSDFYFKERIELIKQGLVICMPPSLKDLLEPQLVLHLSGVVGLGDERKNFLSLSDSVSSEWNIRIGEKDFKRSEFEAVASKARGLYKIGQEYVCFDSHALKNVKDKLDSQTSVMSQEDLMQAILSKTSETSDVALDSELVKLAERVLTYEYIPAPENLMASLRPYQQRGFNWLVQNIQTGFGSVLADDMGLGKTLQVITAILHLKNLDLINERKVLIVAPMSLLHNWRREVEKFAPSLTTKLYHGDKKNRDLEGDYDILLTSYGVLRGDKKKISERKWLLFVIDEAQNIKNPSTEQTKAIKSINAPHKIAMTGTPVENRLLEYWSIFDFVNKNYLSTAATFQKRFATPIEKERSEEHLERFRKVTAPFILRRVKTDKSIIADLPDKVEINGYCTLTKDQEQLYESLVEPSLEEIDRAEGLARKGLVFGLMTQLKQICNHPASFSDELAVQIDSSGKFLFLEELLSDILENEGEKVIIFTQYVRMGNIMTELLQKRFAMDIPFFHGSLSLSQRTELVDSFQTNENIRVMVISLKAGGTGLNLTRASHVIHYDLWWNPAVEAQATDRAHRIGQESTVMVHRLISEGTLEESIDSMLQRKKDLANITVGSGESWVTELSSTELRELVRLRHED